MGTSGAQGLNDEARAALRDEKRRGMLRSLAIAMAFAGPFSFIQDFSPPLWSWIAFGLPMGLAMPWLHSSILGRLRHRSFLVTMVRQAVVYVVAIWVCLSISMLLTIAGGALPEASVVQVLVLWARVITNPYFLSALPLAILLMLPIRFLMGLSRELGPGVLGKWLRGFYHEPREEERIFMFLDMKDSTTLAERLGNLKFSALVRDFFEDLTLPVLQTRCEVSHYIGDEAVLTWTMPSGLDRANCFRLFFEFEKAIESRREFYVARYGLAPEFKAGAHCGLVVATEVGEVKSEIVYHGDVLNTAARIQGMCNETGKPFLVSDELAVRLSMPAGFVLKPLGAFDLKGKEAKTSLWAVERE